jgi:hypothetical protein
LSISVNHGAGLRVNDGQLFLGQGDLFDLSVQLNDGAKRGRVLHNADHAFLRSSTNFNRPANELVATTLWWWHGRSWTTATLLQQWIHLRQIWTVADPTTFACDCDQVVRSRDENA